MNPDLGGMLSHKISRSAAAVSAVTVLATLIATLPAQAQTETVLYSFCQRKYCYDGTLPSGSLVLNPNGNIYGVTMVGGAIGQGTLYGIKPDGTEEVLHSFGNAPGDGIFPYGLIADSKGDLYGTTKLGGANGLENEGDGTVFKITAGVETILYNFGATSSDGINPQAGVVRDTKGNLYGTTIGGGANGAGTVFKLTPAGVETILHSFAKNGTDGNQADEMLTLDEKENVYGTTSYGGLNNAGIAFEISAAGTYTILYSFGTSASDGAYPFSSLTLDSAGNLYGTRRRAARTMLEPCSS
ncbi:MAG: choice-of-anchor tandem repeat GloVer-containing protein [Candidatus Sulfotelmatobacter sp.]